LAQEEHRIRDEDAARVDGYLVGDAGVFGEVDRWIAIELRHRYPGLSAEHEDLCQTVHEKLLDNLRAGRYEGRSALRTYVTGITHHTAVDRVRQLRRHREGLAFLAREAAVDREARPGAERFDVKLLHRVVMALPAACKELWYLTFVESLGYQEIGRRLSIPEGTVKSRMWHCRKKAGAALRRLRRAGSGSQRE